MKIDRPEHPTGLQNDEASSPSRPDGAAPNAAHEYAALSAQLAARTERLWPGASKPQPSTRPKFSAPRLHPGEAPGDSGWAAQLAARAERLGADSASPARQSTRSPLSASHFDPPPSPGRIALSEQLAARAERLGARYPTSPAPSGWRFPLARLQFFESISRFATSLAVSGRASHVWAGSLLLMLFAGIALAFWGLSSPPSRPSASPHREQAKARAADVDKPEEKASPPVSPMRVALPPPVAPSAVAQELAKSTPEPPPPLSTPQVPAAAQASAAPLTTDEIRELQGRLRAAGFSPGPIDGVVGPMTLGAVRKYAQSRAIAGAEATRDLLLRLRKEPPPKK